MSLGQSVVRHHLFIARRDALSRRFRRVALHATLGGFAPQSAVRVRLLRVCVREHERVAPLGVLLSTSALKFALAPRTVGEEAVEGGDEQDEDDDCENDAADDDEDAKVRR